MGDPAQIDEDVILAGRYRVIERLGSGGMATVYLAEDRVLARKVAVKRMRGASEADARRFRREARLGATLTHPNVVTVFDAVAAEDEVLIVMEYVEGETLADALRRGPLDPDQALAILWPIAAALEHAHESGIVHRDVKPANVLIGTTNGLVKLADLGIATASESTRITSTNDIVGTLAYVAPERLDGADPGGPEVDVYALGVLTYEMLSGERFRRGSTPAEIASQAATTPPPDLREVWPEAPEPAARAIREAIDRDPAKRPSSARELVARLEPALRGVEGRQGEPRTREPDPAQRLERTHPLPSPSATSGPPVPAERGYRVQRQAMPGRARALLAAGCAAIATLLALAVVLPGGGGDSTEQSGQGAQGSQGSGGGGSAEASSPSGDGRGGAAKGAALNREGYELIGQGRYEEAVPVLERSVAAFPDGTSDIDYAYALYNLGHALRRSGRPEEAIPILERRLEIPNQRGTVKRELELARAEAGEEGEEGEG